MPGMPACLWVRGGPRDGARGVQRQTPVLFVFDLKQFPQGKGLESSFVGRGPTDLAQVPKPVPLAESLRNRATIQNEARSLSQQVF